MIVRVIYDEDRSRRYDVEMDELPASRDIFVDQEGRDRMVVRVTGPNSTRPGIGVALIEGEGEG